MISRQWIKFMRAMMPDLNAMSGDDQWLMILTGSHPMHKARRIFRLLPGAPRCKTCNAPFEGAIIPVMTLLGRRPSNMNPHHCNVCIELAAPGGAEVELTMLFADVRGSTSLAEGMSSRDFQRLLNRFYKVATEIIVHQDGWVDKFVGDEVIGLFIPGFAGEDHAHHAVEAAQALLQATGHAQPEGAWIPMGIGIHTGVAYVGTIGEEHVTDVTALGDAVNVTARLVAQAAIGEIVISDDTYAAAKLNRPDLEQRTLQLKGRTQTMGVRVMQIGKAAKKS